MGSFLRGAFGANDDFQATLPDLEKQHLLDSIQASQGSLNNVSSDQSALAKQILAQANGQGPNPAQSMLNQATNQNVQQANSLMASQKGINPAMAARVAAQNAAMANQQAAGQASTMNAQQQLGAQSQLAGLYGTMGTQALQNQSILQTAQAAQNNAINQASLGAQGINAGVSAQNSQVSGQLGGGLMSAGSTIATGGAAAGKAFGGFIDGRAAVPGDSRANDTVPTMLSPGEIVIPRSKATDPQKAKDFIDHVMKSGNDSKEPDFGAVIEAQRQMHERLSALEKRSGKASK